MDMAYTYLANEEPGIDQPSFDYEVPVCFIQPSSLCRLFSANSFLGWPTLTILNAPLNFPLRYVNRRGDV